MRTIVFVVLMLLWFPAASRAGTQPVPGDDALKKATAQAESVFKVDIASAKRTGDKSGTAQRILRTALETPNDPASRYVLYQMASHLAADTGDIDVLFNAIHQLESEFAIDAPVTELVLYSALAASAPPKGDDDRLFDAMDTLINDAIRANHYDVARRAASTGEKAAGHVNQPAAEWFNHRLKEIAQVESAYAAAKAAIDRLDKDPADHVGNQSLGKFLCFWQSDWKNGLPRLIVGDVDLMDLAKADLANSTSSADELKLADGWWEYASPQKGMAKARIELHAAERYRDALDSLSGLRRALAEKKVIEAASNSPPRNPLLARIQYWDSYGSTPAELKVGQYTHNNEDCKLTYVADFLGGKPFSQIVGGSPGSISFKVVTPGTIFLFKEVWSGYAPQRAILTKMARREPAVAVRNTQGQLFEVWSMTCEAGQTVNFPFAVMLCADRVEKVDHPN